MCLIVKRSVVIVSAVSAE